MANFVEALTTHVSAGDGPVTLMPPRPPDGEQGRDIAEA
jgi:hypothetical protein